MKKKIYNLYAITNLIQKVLNHYDYNASNMVHGSIAFIEEGKNHNVICPLENKELKVAEIGVFHGVNSKHIMENLDVKKLYLIDPYNNSNNPYLRDYLKSDGKYWNKMEMETRKKMKKYGDKIVFIKKFSNEAVNDLPDEMDYIYIDGDHSYQGVKSDINNYFGKVRQGGILAGHDIDIPDVLKAVLEFTKKNNLKFTIYKTDWIIVKDKKIASVIK